MADTIKSRIVNTHDTEEMWVYNSAFIPKKGEMIIYDPDNNHPYSRFKIGDGTSTIVELPFVIAKGIAEFLGIKDDVCYIDGGNISDYVVKQEIQPEEDTEE